MGRIRVPHTKVIQQGTTYLADSKVDSSRLPSVQDSFRRWLLDKEIQPHYPCVRSEIPKVVRQHS